MPAERWLFPHVALHSSEAVTLTARRRLEEWPAMEVLGRAAAGHLGRPLRELRLAEVYSCFPAAVRVQQRELGLDPDGTPTLTGGMAFAGGPFNHFVLQSLGVLGGRLRDRAGRAGPAHDGVGHALQARPRRLVGHAAGRERRARSSPTWRPRRSRPPRSCRSSSAPPGATTPATVVSFTVTYGGDEGLDPVRTAIVADLPDGVRTAATCEDAGTARLAVTEGLIGRAVSVKDTTFSL